MPKAQRTGSDLADRKVLADINEFGWHAINILEGDGYAPWTFTIGFYETWRFPELIVIGRSRATAYEMVSIIAAELEENRRPDLGSSDPVGFARWYYRGKEFPLYQLVWPSTEGHNPWDLEVTGAFKARQPVLGKPPP